MPRRRRCRRVLAQPSITYFKPSGVRLKDLEEIILTIEEWEAIRLTDMSGIRQEEAAKKMNISQPTFHRILKSARKKITESIITGKAIRVKGGTFEIIN